MTSTKSVASGRRARLLISAAAGLVLAAGLTAPAGADTDVSKDLDTASTLASTFDVFGVPELSTGLKLASVMVSADFQDSNDAAVEQLQKRLDAVAADLQSLKMRVANDETISNQQAYQLAVSWNNNGMLGSINEKKDGITATMADLLALHDLVANNQIQNARVLNGSLNRSEYGLLTPEQHDLAYRKAQEALSHGENFLDVGLLMNDNYDCQKISYGADRRNEPLYPGEPTDCTRGPNNLWVTMSFLKQFQERYASGDPFTPIWESKGPLINVYRFEPGIALPTFIAEMRTAVLAMQIDLGGADVSKMDPTSPEYRRFKSKYSGMFQRYIDFLTYRPTPEGQNYGNSPYNLATNTNLSISYKAALDIGEQTDVTTWETIDRLRDMLTYAQAHGTAIGWSYARPGYIAQSEPPAHSGAYASASSSMDARLHESGQGQPAAPGPDDANTFLIGATSQGAAYQISVRYGSAGGSLSQSPNPFWSEPDLTALMSAGGYGVFGITQGNELLSGTIGSPAYPAVPAGGVFARAPVKSVFGGGDGVVYAIKPTGELVWSKSVSGGVAFPPRVVGTGWAGFRQVVSAGHGVIYALTSDGQLLWYLHQGYLDGSVAWQGPVTIASGWGQYDRIVACDNGVLVAVRADGSAYYYHHRDYLTGVSASAPLPATNSSVTSLSASARLRSFGGASAATGRSQTAVGAYDRPPEPRPGPTAHLAGPYPLTGTDLSAFPLLAGYLDTSLGSGRIK